MQNQPGRSLPLCGRRRECHRQFAHEATLRPSSPSRGPSGGALDTNRRSKSLLNAIPLGLSAGIVLVTVFVVVSTTAMWFALITDVNHGAIGRHQWVEWQVSERQLGEQRPGRRVDDCHGPIEQTAASAPMPASIRLAPPSARPGHCVAEHLTLLLCVAVLRRATIYLRELDNLPPGNALVCAAKGNAAHRGSDVARARAASTKDVGRASARGNTGVPVKSELEDARKLAHGTYNDVIVAEHRRRAGGPVPSGAVDGEHASPHVVLELPEGSRVIDWAPTYVIDGALGETPPKLGASFRLIVGPPTVQGGAVDAAANGSLRYEALPSSGSAAR